jgi:hypothetical protein
MATGSVVCSLMRPSTTITRSLAERPSEATAIVAAPEYSHQCHRDPFFSDPVSFTSIASKWCATRQT